MTREGACPGRFLMRRSGLCSERSVADEAERDGPRSLRERRAALGDGEYMGKAVHYLGRSYVGVIDELGVHGSVRFEVALGIGAAEGRKCYGHPDGDCAVHGKTLASHACNIPSTTPHRETPGSSQLRGSWWGTLSPSSPRSWGQFAGVSLCGRCRYGFR
jgi:hypothetical protein